MGSIIGALVALYIVIVYNQLVGLRQRNKQGLADIDVQLRQRNDLIPNLVSTVAGYAAHEQAVLDAVMDARRNVAPAAATDTAAEAQLAGALGRLFALAEAYPDLKASDNFQALQQELADVEDKLAAARRAYNAAASAFNAKIESFPALLIARPLGFEAASFQVIGAEEASVAEVPEVRF